MTGEALLRAIIARPADDALRLIYADWLDEQGESGRAAYIRAMTSGRPAGLLCRVVSEPVEYDEATEAVTMWPAWSIRTRRPLSLFDHNQTIAMLPPPEWCGTGAEVGVRHGFIVRYCGGSWTLTGDVCGALAWHPLTRVRFSNCRPDMTPSWWQWYDYEPGGVSTDATLPVCLFGLLTGGRDLQPGIRSYENFEQAINALSRAAIRLARIQAGFYPPAPARDDPVAHADPTSEHAQSGAPAAAGPA